MTSHKIAYNAMSYIFDYVSRGFLNVWADSSQEPNVLSRIYIKFNAEF